MNEWVKDFECVSEADFVKSDCRLRYKDYKMLLENKMLHVVYYIMFNIYTNSIKI